MFFTFIATRPPVGSVVRFGISVQSRFYSLMNSEKQYTYEGAICALNSLQSNAAYLQKARLKRKESPEVNITATGKFLNMLGIEVEELNALNVIHVSGTKGKGSTCAFCESILKQHGLKTGLYSSPHLITVNERIRLEGQPLDKELFSHYFWHVFDTLEKNLQGNENMPGYFLFLTVMAYYVFIKEKVDVAVVEVGIGGMYDCTNVIQKPVCVGVTTLDLDHVHLLGNTIELIAEQKAGIFKPGVPAFTVLQPESAMVVLKKKAQQIGCELRVIPPFHDYEQNGSCFNFGILGIVQNKNASLALQLVRTWLLRNSKKEMPYEPVTLGEEDTSARIPVARGFFLDSPFVNGLATCSWPGRFQVVKKENLTCYLDGAHTPESMKCCVQWFEEISSKEAAEIDVPVCRVLLFNCTGLRNPQVLLDSLSKVYFDYVLFSPNRMANVKDPFSDQSNFTVDSLMEQQICEENRNLWSHLMSSKHENNLSTASNGQLALDCTVQHSDPANTRVFSCLGNALIWVNDSISPTKELNRRHHLQVLVTGSIHLVGGVLSVVDSNLKSNG